MPLYRQEGRKERVSEINHSSSSGWPTVPDHDKPEIIFLFLI